MILEVIANIEDLVRIEMLERNGRLWKGATLYAIDHAFAYQIRLVRLMLQPKVERGDN